MVAVGVVDDLAHVPAVLIVLVLLVEHEQLGRTRLGVGVHVLVFVIEVVERVLPLMHAVAPLLVESAERLGLVKVHELHAVEQRVADQHGEPAPVLHHRGLRARRGQTGGRLRGIIGRAGVLPFVHQTGVDRTHDHAQP